MTKYIPLKTRGPLESRSVGTHLINALYFMYKNFIRFRVRSNTSQIKRSSKKILFTKLVVSMYVFAFKIGVCYESKAFIDLVPLLNIHWLQ